MQYGFMNSLAEIEAAIANLPESDVRQLATWLQDYLENAWDQQIQADVESGRLDKLIQQARQDIAEHQVKPLDEVLDHF
jgi:wobble nucleotide-excising tRNase